MSEPVTSEDWLERADMWALTAAAGGAGQAGIKYAILALAAATAAQSAPYRREDTPL